MLIHGVGLSWVGWVDSNKVPICSISNYRKTYGCGCIYLLRTDWHWLWTSISWLCVNEVLHTKWRRYEAVSFVVSSTGLGWVRLGCREWTHRQRCGSLSEHFKSFSAISTSCWVEWLIESYKSSHCWLRVSTHRHGYCCCCCVCWSVAVLIWRLCRTMPRLKRNCQTCDGDDQFHPAHLHQNARQLDDAWSWWMV